MSDWSERMKRDFARGRFEGASITDNQAWLRANRDKHEGQWVALRHGRLLGAGEDMLTLSERLREEGRITDDKGALFVRMGDDWMHPPKDAPLRTPPSD